MKTTKTEIKLKSGEIIKVGDMFNGIYQDDTCGGYVVSIHKPFGRWIIRIKSFDCEDRIKACYAYNFHRYGLTRVS